MPDLLRAMAAAADGGAGGAEARVVFTRGDVVAARVGEVIVKAHARVATALTARLRIAAGLPGLFLPPIRGVPIRHDDRLLTVWPDATAVDPGDPPWEEAGALLARLHAVAPIPAGAPPAGAPDRLARAIAGLNGGPAAATVNQAYATLPPLRGGDRLVHGDWHLGQLVRYAHGWRLIDVDDLGVGDPAWDLARPAALFAAGLLEPEDWERLLTAYRAAGGTAFGADPWETLDVPARALAVQLAASAITRARRENRPLTDEEETLVDTCGRIAGTPV